MDYTNKSITAQELYKKMYLDKDRLLILDVRDKEDFQQFNIPGSIHLELSQLEEYYVQRLKNQGNKEIIIVCYRGNRSEKVCQHLKQIGINAISLQGGIDLWKSLDT